MTSLNGVNGHDDDVARVPDPDPQALVGLGERTNHLIDEVAAELRAAIVAEQVGRGEFELAIAESKARERRLSRTLTTLEGQPAQPKPAAAKPKPAKSGGGNDWKLSDVKIAKTTPLILAYGLANPKGFSSTGAARATSGLSPETSKRVIEILRGRELVRPAGRVRGGGTRWKLTPDGKAMATAGNVDASS